MRSVQPLAAAALLLLPAYHVASAAEPKQGGVLRMYHRDSPGSASIHEGASPQPAKPMQELAIRTIKNPRGGTCGGSLAM